MLRARVWIRSRDWEWPEFLGALVAAPAHHFLVVENDRVRVLHTVIPPGDIVPLHTNRLPAVLYVEHWSDFIRRDQQGNIVSKDFTDIAKNIDETHRHIQAAMSEYLESGNDQNTREYPNSVRSSATRSRRRSDVTRRRGSSSNPARSTYKLPPDLGSRKLRIGPT